MRKFLKRGAFKKSPFYNSCQLQYNVNFDKLNFQRADYCSINDYFSGIDWVTQFSQYDNINEIVTHFYKMIRGVISEFVPKKRKIVYGKFPPWFTASLIDRLREKNKIRKRYKKYHNPLDKIELNILSERCRKLATVCYNRYINNIEDRISRNTKAFWSFVKSKRGGCSLYPTTMTDGVTTASEGPSICDLFAGQFATVYTKDTSQCDPTYPERHDNCYASFGRLSIDLEAVVRTLTSLDMDKGYGPDGIPPIFLRNCASNLAVPLCLIYNISLATGIFPDEWKVAKVVPVLKSGDNDLVSNYRPISILSTMSKVFEILICPYISEHVKPLITDHQHGFMKSRSTATNLISFVGRLAEAIDARQEVDVIYTDLSKAFDRVPHEILMRKLLNFGIHGFY